jgi:hypothetical protein
VNTVLQIVGIVVFLVALAAALNTKPRRSAEDILLEVGKEFTKSRKIANEDDRRDRQNEIIRNAERELNADRNT